jgi:hypothetical protein
MYPCVSPLIRLPLGAIAAPLVVQIGAVNHSCKCSLSVEDFLISQTEKLRWC